MNFEQEYNKLANSIRWVRDQRGDDKCYKDLEWLYDQLPEGYTPPERDEIVELENCKQYIASCHNPNIKYVSPQRRIEELETLFRGLRENLFNRYIRRHTPEREWEDEEQKVSREISNDHLKRLFDQETQLMLEGKLDCTISTCTYDLMERINKFI